MATKTLAPPTATQRVALKVNLLSETGRHLTSEPVTEADLAGLRSEAWREAFLRKGMAMVPFPEAVFRLDPIFKADSDAVCAGLALEAASPRGGVARCEFYRRALFDVASRAAERLVKFGVLEPGDQYHFEIEVDRERGADLARGDARPTPGVEADLAREDARPTQGVADAGLGSGKVTVKTAPLHFLSAPLRPLLQQSRPVEEQDQEAFHVFFTEAAFAAAEKFSRQGASAAKPIETGAALAGFLGLADDAGGTGDLFVVVTDVLEAVSAAGTELSLTYTGESWNRICRIMSARQLAQPAFRLCGSAHGHNFSPGEPCASCFKTAGPCGAHNIAPSAQDLLWTQSVFAHQPWALCQIFGSNARAEALHGLFTLRQNRLHRRGFFVLPTFEPERWKTICATDLNPK